jgi:DNA repair protein RecN (Recombination protein N)
MITEITIKNLAIIEEIQFEFGSGLNVLTGETGSGKSIITKAIGILAVVKPLLT